MLVNITKEYYVYPGDYDSKGFQNYYDPEFDWTVKEVWDDGENVWGEVEDGEYLDDEYYDD
jgi:hypothetical protein